MGTDSLNGKLYGYAIPGRYGLGHSMLAWARCFLWCRASKAEMLAPDWQYFRLGPYLRREMDKRSYHKLFRKDVYTSGLKRLWLLATAKRFPDGQQLQANAEGGNRIIVFENDTHSNARFFRSLYGQHEKVREELLRISRPEHIRVTNIHGPFIGIHVRIGDFTRVSDPSAFRGNILLPVEWYRDILLSIRRQTGRALHARVFSDGNEEELQPLLQLPNVSLVTAHSALRDMLFLSQATALISSSSGFSMWAAYLGQVPRICFTNQRLERVVASLGTADLEPECGKGEDVPLDFVANIISALHRLEETKVVI
jgi:hypothetical protein